MAFNAGDYKYLGGKTRRYLNTKTGEEISRRKYDELKNKITYEAKAKHNKLINPEKAILRPAKGRKSAQKSSNPKMVALNRLKAEKEKAEKKEQAKREKELQRKIARGVNRKVRRSNITKQSLKSGRMGVRKEFADYDDYLILLKQAQTTGVIHAYGIGIVGVSQRDGQPIYVTVFRLRLVKEIIPEDEFLDDCEAAAEGYAYVTFTHYFMHFAYKKEYAEYRKKKAGK